MCGTIVQRGVTYFKLFAVTRVPAYTICNYTISTLESISQQDTAPARNRPKLSFLSGLTAKAVVSRRLWRRPRLLFTYGLPASPGAFFHRRSTPTARDVTTPLLGMSTPINPSLALNPRFLLPSSSPSSALHNHSGSPSCNEA